MKSGSPVGLNKLNPDNFLTAKDFLLLQRVIKKVNSILDKGELLKQIVEDVSKTLGFTRCAVLLYHEDTDQLEIAALTGWNDDNFYPGYRVNRDEGIVWKAVREQRIIYIPDVLDFPDEIPCAFTSRSHMDIPLYHRNKFIGILNAQNTRINAFSKHDLRLLKTLASHISIAIENSRLFEIEKKEKEIMRSELKEAKEIQSRLFPKKSPTVQNFRIRGMCEPSYEVGGDWYDYIELPSGKIGVVLADVAGKGLSAALLMSSARTIFRVVASAGENPSAVLKKVNEYLIHDLPATRFITMIYLIVDPESGKITMSNAGHMWPIHKSHNWVGQTKYDTAFPLGIQEDDYKDYEISLKPGDKLILYSDGVSEAVNMKGQFFDERMIFESIKKERADMNTVYSDLKAFAGSAAQNDDITLVEIERVDNQRS
jgi:sigma-B regulation protein RsbU (phosphoserine phosphatase)